MQDTKAAKTTTISTSGAITGGGDLSANRTITHSTSSGHNHIPTGGASGQILGWNSTGVAQWVAPASGTTNLDIASQTATTLTVSSSTGTNVVLPAATTSYAGLMTEAQFDKLGGVTTGATKTTVNNTLTSSSTTEALSANQGRILDGSKLEAVNYATSTTGGTIKIRFDGTDLYITNNGTNA